MHVPYSRIAICENVIIPGVAENMHLFWEIIHRLFQFSLFSPVENQLLWLNYRAWMPTNYITCSLQRKKWVEKKGKREGKEGMRKGWKEKGGRWKRGGEEKVDRRKTEGGYKLKQETCSYSFKVFSHHKNKFCNRDIEKEKNLK